MIFNQLPISSYSGVLKFDMKIFVNVTRLVIGQLFTQGTRRGHPYTLDTFLVAICEQQRRRSACASAQSDSIFAVRCLGSIIPLVFISEISNIP